MTLSKAAKVWLDGVAEGNDHAALCACEVFAALESNGAIGGQTSRWLHQMATQRKYPMVRQYAKRVQVELERLRGESAKSGPVPLRLRKCPSLRNHGGHSLHKVEPGTDWCSYCGACERSPAEMLERALSESDE
jgi:hypothetical protein